jgi:hypothetical protein
MFILIILITVVLSIYDYYHYYCYYICVLSLYIHDVGIAHMVGLGAPATTKPHSDRSELAAIS